MKKTPLKNCAVINDITGYGRCALNVAIPVMSSVGIRVLTAPTAVLSNHTGFDEYYFSDLTDGMEKYFNRWQRLGLEFDGIYTGFLGSERQVDIISSFIKKAKGEKTLLFVDPVMGDNGKLYATYTQSLVEKMRELAFDADIITPNLTEACLLAGREYGDYEAADEEKLLSLAAEISGKGPKCVIITGCRRNDRILNVVYRKNEKSFVSRSKYIGREYCGTGDLFASLLAGYVIRGETIRCALKKTERFLCRAVRLSEKLAVCPTDGIAFESILKKVR